jgi:hypothetical protein
MNKYTKGKRNELKTIRYLERQGYRCLRSAGSRSPFDIVAFGPYETLLIQVRSNRFPSISDIIEMDKYPTLPSIKKVIHVWKDHYMYPIVRPVTIDDIGNRRKRGRKADLDESSNQIQ